MQPGHDHRAPGLRLNAHQSLAPPNCALGTLARPSTSVSNPAQKKRECPLSNLRARLGRRRLQSYSASGVGFSLGGSIANVFAVKHVIEKLPVNATNATKLSSPMVFSAAA